MTGLKAKLAERIAAGKVLVVVGTGVSLASTNGERLASWKGLITNGIEHCAELGLRDTTWVTSQKELLEGDLDDLLGVAEQVSRRLGWEPTEPCGGDWNGWLRGTVGGLRAKYPELIEAIRDLGVPIATLNYDNLLTEVTGYRPIPWQRAERWLAVLQGDDKAILHLHGHWDHPSSVVLGIRSYDVVLGQGLAQHLQRAFSSWLSLAFIGCSATLEDPNFSALLIWMREQLSGLEHSHYLLIRENEPLPVAATVLRQARVVPLPYGREHTDLLPFIRDLAPKPRRARKRTLGKRRSLPSRDRQWREQPAAETGALGELHNVPDLPPNFVVRPDVADEWRQIPGNEHAYNRLREVLATDEAIAFVGAGASSGLYPLWTELIRQLSDKVVEQGMATDKERTLWLASTTSPQQAVRGIKKALGDGPYGEELRKIFAPRLGADGNYFTPAHGLLVRLAFRGFVTTNYDRGLIAAQEKLRPDRWTSFATWKDHDNVHRWLNGKIFHEHPYPILFAHGIYERSDTIVLGVDEYRQAYNSGPYRKLFDKLWGQSGLVFVGFGFSDPWLTFIANSVITQTAASSASPPQHIAIIGLKPSEDYSTERRRIFRDAYNADPLFLRLQLRPTAPRTIRPCWRSWKHSPAKAEGSGRTMNTDEPTLKPSERRRKIASGETRKKRRPGEKPKRKRKRKSGDEPTLKPNEKAEEQRSAEVEASQGGTLSRIWQEFPTITEAATGANVERRGVWYTLLV